VRVVVDTPVWSLALRRAGRPLTVAEADVVAVFRELLTEGRCVLPGLVRQEVLQGIARKEQFELVRRDLAELPDEAPWASDYVRAAQMYNRCRGRGVQPTTVDMFLCALAARLKAAIFTLDEDFVGYARVLGLPLLRVTMH
jgi:predicted nucleic acid-binding protein